MLLCSLVDSYDNFLDYRGSGATLNGIIMMLLYSKELKRRGDGKLKYCS